MQPPPRIYMGVDPSAGRHQYTWAILDSDCQLVEVAGGELDDLTKILQRFPSVIVAVNSPSKPNLGLLQEKLALTTRVHLRGVDMRLCEYELRSVGITVPPTPSRTEVCAAWIQLGFLLHNRLSEIGFANFPNIDAERQKMETNPHAVFCTLIGQVPLPKPSLEGRLQRQSILRANGASIADPMDFFEEITLHKLIHGLLPFEFLHKPEELDAIAAALTAWIAENRKDEFMLVGDAGEGQMALPTNTLKTCYP